MVYNGSQHLWGRGGNMTEQLVLSWKLIHIIWAKKNGSNHVPIACCEYLINVMKQCLFTIKQKIVQRYKLEGNLKKFKENL